MPVAVKPDVTVARITPPPHYPLLVMGLHNWHEKRTTPTRPIPSGPSEVRKAIFFAIVVLVKFDRAISPQLRLDFEFRTLGFFTALGLEK